MYDLLHISFWHILHQELWIGAHGVHENLVFAMIEDNLNCMTEASTQVVETLSGGTCTAAGITARTAELWSCVLSLASNFGTVALHCRLRASAAPCLGRRTLGARES